MEKLKGGDIVNLREKWSTEKELQRREKRCLNEEGFKQSRSVEKVNERSKKRLKDEEGFKEISSNEKAKLRAKKRTDNEPEFQEREREIRAKTRLNKISTDNGRGKCFRDSIRDGRIYECVSCHRVWFKNGVKPFTPEFEDKLEKDHKGIINAFIGRKETTKRNGQYQICTTCRNYVSKGKVPLMSNQNKLQLMDLSNFEELHLTELENSLIALNIIFQKIFKLPKSRWPAMKDKTVNIPIFQTDKHNRLLTKNT